MLCALRCMRGQETGLCISTVPLIWAYLFTELVLNTGGHRTASQNAHLNAGWKLCLVAQWLERWPAKR